MLCVLSKIQVRQWFVTNYSNISCLDCTRHIEEFYYFQLEFDFYQVTSYMPSSPLGVYKPLITPRI